MAFHGPQNLLQSPLFFRKDILGRGKERTNIAPLRDGLHVVEEDGSREQMNRSSFVQFMSAWVLFF